MKPTIGRIVVIHWPEAQMSPPVAAIITQVLCETQLHIKASGFIPNGDISAFNSLPHKSTASETEAYWDWPERVA